MSIFASRTQQTIDLPFDPPHTVTIRKLAGRHLAKARQAHHVAAIETLKAMGGASFQQELGALGDAPAVAAVIAKQQADPLNGYDRTVVLQSGITAWSYEEPVTAEALEDLTEDAAVFLARAILELTLPARTEATVKNGSGSSSVV